MIPFSGRISFPFPYSLYFDLCKENSLIHLVEKSISRDTQINKKEKEE